MYWVNLYTLQPEDTVENPNETNVMEEAVLVNLTEIKDGEYIPPKMRYFKIPQEYPIDLKENFENYKFRRAEYKKKEMGIIEHFLLSNNNEARRFLHEENGQIKVCLKADTAHFIMKMPYYEPGSFYPRKIFAMKVGCIIFIVPINEKKCPTMLKLSDSYYYKLIQHCFTDSPNTPPNLAGYVDENNQLYGIFNRRIKEFDILYSAQVHGIKNDAGSEGDLNIARALDKCQFVFTNLRFEVDLLKKNWRQHPRMIDVWLKSDLTNASDVYFGFRSHCGVINSPIMHVPVVELSQNQKWKPKVCSKFLHKFLTMINEKMESSISSMTVYEFDYDAELRTVKYRVHGSDTSPSFLSTEFINFLQKK